ncbi:hypothetical protein EB72_24905 [Mycobacterium sp. SWH-M1]|nr:hypothetical protein EB72_24905 [Mycobacterium sp. SWH-M1]
MTNPNTAAAAATEKVAESAKKAPAKRAPKTAATVTEIGSKAKDDKVAKAPAPKLPYSATSRSGKVATRSFDRVMSHAVDVADDQGRTEAARKGLIWKFFPTKEAAQAWADKQAEAGYDAKVVPARAAN